MYVKKNPNPCRTLVGDCVIRAISIAENRPWLEVYMDICATGAIMCDMPSSNAVWRSYLIQKGYGEHLTEGDIRVVEFTAKNPKGTFVVGTGTHVIAIIDGNHLDTWDSGDERITVYYKKGEVKDANAV